MTVGDLIRKLQEFDERLPVCLADWSEGHSPPNLSVVEDISLQIHEEYDSRVGPIRGDFVCIG